MLCWKKVYLVDWMVVVDFVNWLVIVLSLLEFLLECCGVVFVFELVVVYVDVLQVILVDEIGLVDEFYVVEVGEVLVVFLFDFLSVDMGNLSVLVQEWLGVLMVLMFGEVVCWCFFGD